MTTSYLMLGVLFFMIASPVYTYWFLCNQSNMQRPEQKTTKAEEREPSVAKEVSI
jgi:hypothetical protein